MTLADPALELHLGSGGDIVRAERLARALRAELNDIDGVEVRFASGTGQAPAGAKGASVLADATLWVFLGTASKATARVLIAAINAWSTKEKNRTVRITSGDTQIEIPGSPDEATERIITRILENGDS